MDALKRILLMLFCVCITAFTLHQFAKLIAGLLSIQYDWKFELSMVLGQLVFQTIFIFKESIHRKIQYFSEMLKVSMIGSVLLWPLLLFNHIYSAGDVLNVLYFFGVVLFMFFDHKRRVKELNLPFCVSYTWVLYRCLILIFILI
jgi:hypothetical protein